MRILFCLGALGRTGPLLAEVTDTEDLSITEACHRFPREARACELRRMAKRWRGGKVRCIVLSNARPAPEYINLSAGCLGLASQFVGKIGVPRFCRKRDLHKTVAVTLSDGQIVHQSLVRSWPLIACQNCAGNKAVLESWMGLRRRERGRERGLML